MIEVHKDLNYIISNEGSLIINQARLTDAGNYTCGAQNMASRRLSEVALLTVFGKSTLADIIIDLLLIADIIIDLLLIADIIIDLLLIYCCHNH